MRLQAYRGPTYRGWSPFGDATLPSDVAPVPSPPPVDASGGDPSLTAPPLVDAQGNVLDAQGNVVVPAGSTTDAQGNMLDAQGNVVVTVAATPPPTDVPQGYLWPDGYYHADPPPAVIPAAPDATQPAAAPPPSFWVDLFSNAVVRAVAVSRQQPVPVVYAEPPPPLWLWVGGTALAVLVIRALR